MSAIAVVVLVIILLLEISLPVASATAPVVSTVNKEECLAKGFNHEILECKTCELLESSISDKTLHQECSQCCTVKEVVKYQHAVLEVDKRFLGAFPALQALIKRKAALGFKIRYRYNVRPQLYLYHEKTDEIAAETLSVGQWDESTFEDYLAQNVVRKDAK